jgi:methionine synthase II (cobalamin-independent)
MKTKEKAKELVEAMAFSCRECDYEAKAKQCALIAVDEIILSRKDDSQFDDTLWAGGSDIYKMHPMYLNYWQEVKQEIENL